MEDRRTVGDSRETQITVCGTDLNRRGRCGGESAPPRGDRLHVPQGRPQLQSQKIIEAIRQIIDKHNSNAFSGRSSG